MSWRGFRNIYVSGQTSESLAAPNAGSGDVFVSQFNTAGNILWTRQFGGSQYDVGYSVSEDGLGNVFTAGYTEGCLGGPNTSYDAFVAKIVDPLFVPEPSALALAAISILSLAGCIRRRQQIDKPVRT